MGEYQGGPASPLFHAVSIAAAKPFNSVGRQDDPEDLSARIRSVPVGSCVFRGLPFQVNGVVRVAREPVTLRLPDQQAKWLVFLHAATIAAPGRRDGGFPSPTRGRDQLAATVGSYEIGFSDGSEVTVNLRSRHEIAAYSTGWGENQVGSVPATAFRAAAPHHETRSAGVSGDRQSWGLSQTRVTQGAPAWMNQLFAWENPFPDRAMVSVTCRASDRDIFLFGLCAGNSHTNPIRWEMRRKAIIDLPGVASANPPYQMVPEPSGRFEGVAIDLGTVISVMPQRVYPNDEWPGSHNNLQPELSVNRVAVEFTAHPDARLYVERPSGREIIRVSELADASLEKDLVKVIPPSHHRIRIRVVEAGRTTAVPAKIHIHGEDGEYLAPVDRHRTPNYAWFEDYSTDFVHLPAGDQKGRHGMSLGPHYCTYVPGETHVDVPLGSIYIEVSRGFEIAPVRKQVTVTKQTDVVTIELERVLSWRQRGWVSADTHVHFLSPTTALIEGSAEGINVVNLLASQWGELMTNVGDFDGKTTWGSRETGGDGEHLVRVGTENRQHVMGHISLLGYEGSIIAPMTTGGPDESALGDPVEVSLTQWARQCRAQNGVVILPHFPDPRLENAAAIVDGSVDGVEMTSLDSLYKGIDPYSLSDWYRFLNCGYQVAAVGGTDKMSAATAVGTSRTYTRVPTDRDFTFEGWREAIKTGQTFVTYGPLLEFSISGTPMGGSVSLPATGGVVEASWEVASVTVPVTSVELVVNGCISQRYSVDWDRQGSHGRSVHGSWSVPVRESSWFALLVRGRYPENPEIIASHSSAVMVNVEGSELCVEHDAASILDQIEGALAYVHTVGTRAQTDAYRRMREVLQSVRRRLHNRMHQLGRYHAHTPAADHEEHHT